MRAEDTTHHIAEPVLSADHMFTDVFDREGLLTALTQEECSQRFPWTHPSTLPHRAQT